MMRKLSLKVAWHFALGAGLILVLFACVKPINLESFLEDPEVVAIIEKNTPKVKIVDSDPDLKAGDRKITGLDPEKYYVVEEWGENEAGWDKNEAPLSVQFIKGDGTRTKDLVDIGWVSGGALTGLLNFRYYRVRTAGPLAGVYYDDLPSPLSPLPNTKTEITNGEITLFSPKNTYYMEIPSAVSGYRIVKIPNDDSALYVTPINNIIELEGEGTTDYVFAEIDNDEIIPENFYVLRVTITKPVEVNVRVTFDITDATLELNPSTVTFSQADLLGSSTTVTFTLSNAADFSSVTWKYGNKVLTDTDGDDGKLTLDLIEGVNVDFLVIGQPYQITVIVERGGVPYTGYFTLKINLE